MEADNKCCCCPNCGENDKRKLIINERNGNVLEFYCTNCKSVTKVKKQL